MRTVIFLLFFLVSVAFGVAEAADVNFGFNGRYKTGTWAPLRITVQGREQPTPFIGNLVVDVRNFSSDTPMERYATELHLRTTEEKQKSFYVYYPKNATQLVVQLVPTTPAKKHSVEEYTAECDTGGSVTDTSFTERLFRIGISAKW